MLTEAGGGGCLSETGSPSSLRTQGCVGLFVPAGTAQRVHLQSHCWERPCPAPAAPTPHSCGKWEVPSSTLQDLGCFLLPCVTVLTTHVPVLWAFCPGPAPVSRQCHPSVLGPPSSLAEGEGKGPITPGGFSLPAPPILWTDHVGPLWMAQVCCHLGHWAWTPGTCLCTRTAQCPCLLPL